MPKVHIIPFILTSHMKTEFSFCLYHVECGGQTCNMIDSKNKVFILPVSNSNLGELPLT